MEVTPGVRPPLPDVPKGLRTEGEVRDFYKLCQRTPTISPRALRKIREACDTRICILRLTKHVPRK